jgi:AcrR family transcriptional regulator
VVSREVAAVEEAASRPGELVDRIVAVVETFAGRALKAPRLAYALLAEPVDAPVEAERLVFRRRFADVFTHWIDEGIRSGLLPPQDAHLTAAATVGAVAEVLVGPLAAGSADPDTIPSLVTFTIRALGGTDARDA